MPRFFDDEKINKIQQNKENEMKQMLNEEVDKIIKQIKQVQCNKWLNVFIIKMLIHCKPIF